MGLHFLAVEGGAGIDAEGRQEQAVGGGLADLHGVVVDLLDGVPERAVGAGPEHVAGEALDPGDAADEPPDGRGAADAFGAGKGIKHVVGGELVAGAAFDAVAEVECPGQGSGVELPFLGQPALEFVEVELADAVDGLPIRVVDQRIHHVEEAGLRGADGDARAVVIEPGGHILRQEQHLFLLGPGLLRSGPDGGAGEQEGGEGE